MTAHFHFTEQPLALHLLLQRAQSLIDVIVADYYFYQAAYLPSRIMLKVKETSIIGYLQCLSKQTIYISSPCKGGIKVGVFYQLQLESGGWKGPPAQPSPLQGEGFKIKVLPVY